MDEQSNKYLRKGKKFEEEGMNNYYLSHREKKE
jgi:hypothetical protein